MKKITFYTLGILFLLAISTPLFAQDYNDKEFDTHTINIIIPTITLLDIEAEGSTIDLTFGFDLTAGQTTGEAGLKPEGTIQSKDLWLNYTSLSNTKTRKITVALTSGTMPTGVKLFVSPSTVTTGEGERGTAAANVEITGTATDVITGIGSCYTEDGVDKGSKLTYALKVDDWSTITPGTTNGLVVTYTLID